MTNLLRLLLLLIILPALHLSSLAQTASKEKRAGTAFISGHVTIERKAAQGVTVVAASSDYGPLRKTYAQSVTDAEGRFQLSGVPAGQVTVQALADGFVSAVEGTSSDIPAKTISVADGETVENLEFALVRGGVITGRVTQTGGQPVIEERLSIELVDEAGKKVPSFYFNSFAFQTDDRGVYRIYGLRAGRYLVSSGQTKGTVRLGFGGRFFPQTFYPGVTDEAKATIVEVTSGGEATGIDIALEPPKQTYTATGRIVNAETGKPVPDMTYGYGTYDPAKKRVGAFGFNNNATNAKGEFRIEGLLPDQYAAFAFVTPDSAALADSYSDPVKFEITDANVENLEIKVHRGATITGVAVLENPNDRAALAQLSKLQLRAFNSASEIGTFSFRTNYLNADGSFLLKGLRPGKTRISLGGYPLVKGFSLVRVERNGAEQREGIDVGAGEQISGVRLILAYGSGTVRGQIEIRNGTVPQGARLSVVARRSGEDQTNTYGAWVDERNRFLIENVPPGTYELTLKARIFSSSDAQTPPRDVAAPVKQTITVAEGAEVQTSFTLDLSANSSNEGKIP